MTAMTTTSPNSRDRRTVLDTLFDQAEADRIPLSPSEPGVSAYVLEAIDTADVLRDEPVSILCPGCREVVREYLQGLPPVVHQFLATCHTCGELKRWSAVAIPTAHVESVSPTELERVVTNVWEQWMWAGIQTAEQCPRTREFCELFDEAAEMFGWSWRLRCPLCRRTLSQIGDRYLDYHHWNRADDIGVSICRACHDVIGRNERDMQVDWRARKRGLLNKHTIQIARLAAREVIVAGATSLDTLVDRLIDRYNLPFEHETIACLLTQTLGDPEMREQILDDDIWEDLASESGQ